ncbi:dihydroxy-acid dehydratase [Rhodococcus ruber]|uniref:dihydroxy-acid dehydratase domain-containing protein n=1 Tax=Rhodococcus ruber TaxID=1830 RepID=UPI003CCAD981
MKEIASSVHLPELTKLRKWWPAGGDAQHRRCSPSPPRSSIRFQVKVALVIDETVSGSTRGFCVEHVNPEVAMGRSVGLLEDGHLIAIHVDEGTNGLRRPCARTSGPPNRQELQSRLFPVCCGSSQPGDCRAYQCHPMKPAG